MQNRSALRNGVIALTAVWAASFALAAEAATPKITSQPQNQTVPVGATATFAVVASGTAPLKYRWSKDGRSISGATSASYTTPATVANTSGSTFSVRVSNRSGSATSNSATLTVTGGATAPSITSQPQTQSVPVGATATFTVAASGTAPMSYQWSKNGSTITGATSTSYTTAPTVSGDNGSTFSVRVSNSAGNATSNLVTLTVTTASTAPSITSQPQNQTVVAGGTATFSVVATGTAPLSYQWSMSGSVIGGATAASYTTPATTLAQSGETFSVTVSNSAGSQTSNVVTLTVNPSSGGSGAPMVFQHIASSTDPLGNGIPGHTFTFHTESLPANTVAVMGVSAPSNVAVTISDALAGSWSTAACSASGGNNDNTKAWVFVQSLGGTGGPDTITINVGSADIQPVQFDITFWQNISTSSPVNGSRCAGNLQGSAVNPGSFMPTTNNDANGGNIIWNYTAICTGYAGGNPTKWVPGSGFSLLNGEIIWASNQGFPEASQYYLQATQASVTPSITASGDTADCFNSASVALTVANSGAVAPSTIHVASILHESFNVFRSPGTQVVQTPTVGNLRVMAFTWGGGCLGNACIGSIASSDGCTWTLIGGGGAAEQAYAENCAPCSACTTSITYAGSNTMPAASFRLYDIENAVANSYQNSMGADGACAAPAATNAPGNFTPTGANSGLTIATIGNGQGPITGLAAGSPAGTFDLWTFSGQTDSDIADNADGQAHYYYSTKATQTWNWAKQNANDGCAWWASNYN